ncbi:hypothetical protein HOC01_01730 [archaeon]|jgi:hypothetical protein|nr:hypothetical protein [archaeon]MBT6697960.1 hypothetical protein [archaeon]
MAAKKKERGKESDLVKTRAQHKRTIKKKEWQLKKDLREHAMDRRDFSRGRYSKKHKATDYLLLAFIAIAGVAILVLLASYFTATGDATDSGAIDSLGVVEIISQESVLHSGSGVMKCNYKCGQSGSYAIASTLDGEIVQNNAVISGDWTCLCALG